MSVVLDLETDSEVSIDIMDVLGERQAFTQNDVEILLVKVSHPELETQSPSFDRLIWGRTMLDWVKLGLGGKVTLVDGDGLDKIKSKLTDKPITLVAYSDTPLLNLDLVGHMLSIVNLNFNKIHNFRRCFMGATKLFKSATALPTEIDARFKNLFNLRMVDDFVSLNQVEEELQRRIVVSHMKNGVHFLNSKSVQIDVGVKIGKNVTVGPNIILKGKTTICDGVVLEMNDIIENGEIGEGVNLTSCVIRNSKIGKNSLIKPFSVIENGKLKGE